MESIKNLIAENPSGILQMKKPLSFAEYRDNYGFGLEKVWTIFESKEYNQTKEHWFAFRNKTLETLFSVEEETSGDFIHVYLVETIKDGKVHCHLILSDDGFKSLMKTSKVLKVHQMFSKFLEDHIALNMN